MTVRAVCVLCVQVMLRTRGLFSTDTMSRTVTRQTKLCYATRDQQTRIRRTVRRMTRDATVRLDRRVLVNKRSLLVCVTLDARCVGAGRESRLLELKTAVRIVAITALHRAFQHFVMERQLELMLRFAVATHTELWLAVSQQSQIGETRLL